jgi:drug/metabolite transporter (DMT)-like permease
MSLTVPYLGEVLSLLSAVVWALAVIFFRKSGEKVHPLALNMFKNTLALVLFLPTMWIFGKTLLHSAPISTYVLLLLSGVIGIGIGDTLLFKSLNILGAGLTGLVVCMYSPFIICLSILFLNETLTILQVLGAVFVISAVLIATIEKPKVEITPKNLFAGVLLGVIASGAMAVGIVMIKPILESSPLLWVTEIRLFGGALALGIILIAHPKRSKIFDSLVSTKSWSYTISGSLIGAYLAMIIWLGGMKYTQASIASALNQTTTIFIFIFGGIILREPMHMRRTAGVILAFIGAALVSFG